MFLTAVLVLHSLAASCSWAQPSAPPVDSAAISLQTLDNRSRTQLAQAEALLESGQHREAIENVISVLDAAPDQLVQVRNASSASQLGFATFVPARQVVHQWLADLSHRSPEALGLYRRQVDPQAEQLYSRAQETQDASLLRRIVDDLFTSQRGDDALLQLGELARQRGDYTRAREYWERVDPRLRYVITEGNSGRDAYPWWLLAETDSTARPDLRAADVAASSTWLAYPDTNHELQQIAARLILTSILEGHQRRAAVELEFYQQQLNAGRLAGRDGEWKELLGELLTDSQSWSVSEAMGAWRTLGGNSQRLARRAASFDLGGRPIWRQPLPTLSVVNKETGERVVRTAEDPTGLLSVHPVVVDGVAVYAMGLSEGDIEAVRLSNGGLVFPRRAMITEQEIPHLPGAPTVPRITTTAHDQTLFALTLDRRSLPARLVALDLAAERRLQFAVELDGPEWPGSWIFEGAPLADARAVYVSVRRIDQVRHACQVACFDRRDGALLWRRFVCRAEPGSELGRGYVSNLLTLDQGVLYYNTNLGVVAAIQAADGFPKWAVRYPSRPLGGTHPDRNDTRRFRDLVPCLVHRDFVVVAPRDCEHIFALDAITGSTLWLTPPNYAADAVHLLGVGQDHLLVSGESLYWFDIATGRPRGRFPSTFHGVPAHARPSPRGYGRGLLAAEQVYWPTRSAIYVFDQQTVKTDQGWQPRLVRRIDLRSRGATGGNLVLQDDVLLIAGANQLFAFNQTGMRDVGNGSGSGPEAESGLPQDPR